MASRRDENSSSPPSAGGAPLRWLANLLLLAGVGFAVWQILQPAVRASQVRGDVVAASAEARSLYQAFERYFERNQAYPNAYGDAALEVETFEPLRKRGYYRGGVAGRLVAGQPDGYDSPDDKGLNQEFWLEMSLARDPSVRFLIANSNDAPLGGGKWREGAFLYRNGTLEAL